MSTHQSSDEWKLEQGLAGAEIPVLDQTPHEHEYTSKAGDDQTGEKGTTGANETKPGGDAKTLFVEEREGWDG